VTRVVCVGLATLDTILALPRHPEPDDRVVAEQCIRAGGGPAATAAVALARLGVEVAFVGAVGDDAAGEEIREGLAREAVDIAGVEVVRGARSPQSTILVGATGTRAIVTVPGAQLERVEADAVDGAEWVHVDHVGYAAVRGLEVRLSVDGGNPVPELNLAGVALYAPTETAVGGDAEAGARAAVAAGAELAVVTRGADGAVAATRDGELVAAPGHPVEVVGTLGAGDVFHGALLAALVRGDALADALAFANRIAALSCRALDGRSAIPSA
jgi:sulfofructose kinase